MTEKRFTLGYEDDFLRWIRDNLNQKNYVVRIGFGEEDNLQDVCDLLNQLNNENEQLKRTISTIDFAIIRKYGNSLENLLEEVYDGKYNKLIDKQVLRAKKLDGDDGNDWNTLL